MDSRVSFDIEELPGLAELETLWRAWDRAGEHSFFTSWTWIGALLRTVQQQPSLLRAMRGGKPAGLALLTMRKGRFRGVLPIRQAWFNASGDSELDGVTIEHNGFALPGPCDDSLWPSFTRWFADADFADELIAPAMPSDCDGDAREPAVIIEKSSHGYRTPLAGLGPDGIAAVLSSNARQQLRRSMRDYGDALSLDRASDTVAALEYFGGLKDLHTRSWARRSRQHAFDNPFFEPFHRALIGVGMVESSVDLLRIRAGERVIGYLYNFRRNGVVSSYQSGFDDENPALRPGYVCHALAMAHYARAGERVYDFLAGANRLKQSFGTERYALTWCRHRKPTLAFRGEHLARRALRFAERLSGPRRNGTK